jgi:hypothetical protein
MAYIEDLCQVYKNLKGKRGNWETHWEEIAERILPRQIGFVGDRSDGEKKTQKVFDSKPLLALDRFAAVMDSMLTPRQQKWHNLRTTNEELNRDFEVQDWFYKVNNIMFQARYSPKANFAGQNYERWVSVGAFGTGALFIDYEPGVGLRYRCCNLRDLYLLENHQGVIDTVFREFKYTARQAVMRWGEKMMPEKILKALDSPHRQNDLFEFLHVVKPREDFDSRRADARGKPIASYYICMETKALVTPEGGFNSFPYSISRYVTAPDEVYGRSPAMSALPDIKMLNEMAKTDIRAVHKLIDPPILLHDDGVLGGGAMTVNMRPGGLNIGGVNRDGRALMQPFGTGARVDINEAKMDQRRMAIDDAFLVTLFQILVETPRMTATEALIRAQEKGMLLTPTMGRQQSEALGPLIEREIDLLMFHNVLPPMPDILVEAGGEYEIVYDSPMSRMQRAEELVGVQRTLELLTPFAQISGPQVFDVIDADALARLTAEVSGVPTPIMRSPQAVAAIREQRAAQEQEAMMMQAAQPLAGAVKDVAQAQSLLQGN